MLISLIQCTIVSVGVVLSVVCIGCTSWNVVEVCVNYSVSFSCNESSFLVSLLVIYFVIIVFSSFYLTQDLNYKWFSWVLFLFLFSIVLLVVSFNVWVLFVAWDGLGVTSFFLVLYYLSWESLNGAIVTVITNRVGDFTLFWFSSGIFFSSYCFCLYYVLSLVLFVLVVTSFTNSAQFPFSSWLPRAMSAPTPVSALVHSSTLVTAGVFLLLKFNWFLFYYTSCSVVLLVGLCTMFFASCSAIVEVDINNVVALSTLSQVGFMFVTLGLGLNFYTLLHLVAHALFNSCLFLQVGFVIHSCFSQQDQRGYGNSTTMSLTIQVQVLVCLLCLCGLVFTSGFVSNDLVLEVFTGVTIGWSYVIVFVVSLGITFLYSLRLCGIFLSISVSPVLVNLNSTVFEVVSGVVLVLAVVLLWWANSNVYSCPISFSFDENVVPLVLLLVVVLVWCSSVKLFVYNYNVYSLFYSNSLVVVSQNSYVNFKLSDNVLVLLNNNLYSVFFYISNVTSVWLSYYSFSVVVISGGLVLLLLVC